MTGEYYFDSGTITMIPPPINNPNNVPTPTATKRPLDSYIKKVRKYLKDYKVKNQLLEDEDGNPIEENTDEDILNAIEFVYYDAVQCPPVRMHIPLSEMSHKLWFLWGVVAFILDSTALDNVRNALAVQDGGVAIDPETYKASTYAGIAAGLALRYERGLKAEKVRYNYENFYGGQGYGTDPPTSAYGRWYGNYGLYY
jgi:hypothetical protein